MSVSYGKTHARSQSSPIASSEIKRLTVLGIYGRREDEQYHDKEANECRSDQVFVRRRLKTFVASGKTKPEERALFRPGEGLVNNWMFHNDSESHEEDREYLEERAVLMQSAENYYKLMTDSNVGIYFLQNRDANTLGFEESIELILDQPSFGEQVIVKGCDSSQISIGDIFEVEGRLSKLKLEVTSPRKPCAYVDRKHNSPFGSKGVKRHTMTHALAGWFCRVLEEGELLDGMQLVRTSHPHPKWTLNNLAKAVFAEGSRMQYLSGKPSWNRDLDELRDLCSLPQLGRYEWGDELKKILAEKEKLQEQRKMEGMDGPVMTVLGIYGRREDEEYHDKEANLCSSEEVFVRRRLKTSVMPGETEPQERALFRPGEGLVNHWMFHNDPESHEEDRECLEERAVLMQSVENYYRLMNDGNVGIFFLQKRDMNTLTFHESIEVVLDQPSFGEQVIVKGCDSSQISIGDIFEVEGGSSKLKLEVASPRKPCAYVDRKHNSPFGSKGMKRHTMIHGLAGWFCRVLEEGELLDGMKLIRTSHPHPKWTLSYISKAVFGEGDKMDLLLGRASWNRDLNELRELCSIAQLGRYEWGDDLKSILQEMDAEKRGGLLDDKAKDYATTDESIGLCIPDIGESVLGALSACACVSPLVYFLFDWSCIGNCVG